MRRLLTLLAVLTLTGSLADADVSVRSPAPESQLRSAPTEVVVDGVTLVLRASLVRNVGPFCPMDGR
jgi:hypothetical protein